MEPFIFYAFVFKHASYWMMTCTSVAESREGSYKKI